MASQKILEKNYEIKDGGVVIVEKVEKSLNKQELRQEIQRYEIEQDRIRQQIEQLKKRYEQLEAAKKEVNEYISQIPDSQLPSV